MNKNAFEYISSIIGDKARSNILWALLDNKAYTATELAAFADISRQSASNHLSKLLNAGLISVEKQGRHKYYRFANEKVALTVESIAGLIPNNKLKEFVKNNSSEALSNARTCYDHLAGKLGVNITKSLISQGIINPVGKEFQVSDYGEKWFTELGININQLKQKKRLFAPKCLDWTERENHLAGSLGAAILEIMIQKDWIRKKENTREILITSIGKRFLSENFNI